MCPLTFSPRDSHASPRIVEIVHTLVSARCVTHVGYSGYLWSKSICLSCFPKRVAVQDRDLFYIKSKHYIIDGSGYTHLLQCMFCKEPLGGASRSVSECRACTHYYLNFISRLEFPVSQYEDPIVIPTGLERLHSDIILRERLRGRFSRLALSQPSAADNDC